MLAFGAFLHGVSASISFSWMLCACKVSFMFNAIANPGRRAFVVQASGASMASGDDLTDAQIMRGKRLNPSMATCD